MNKENIVLSDYEIKGILGKGTFSKVKLGVNKKTNEKVAIKIIDKQFTLNKHNYERIKREISILKNCNHPNVIKVYDSKDDSNNFYFVMEYCKYGELFLHIVNNKRLNDKESSFYFFQLINGLNYLHVNEIVHRDLKPENLLISSGQILKIIDFGLSNYSIENQLLNTPCGSPSYASPEMIKGKKYNGKISDIWSCGVILYVMLCGYLPFEGFNNSDLFKKILKCKVNYPNYIDKSALDLLKNILVANPDKRLDISKIKQHPFYLKGKNIFKQKYPDLTYEIENPSLIADNKTLKKSVSERINLEINNENLNKVNNDKDQNYHYKKNIIISNSVNKEKDKKNQIIEDNNYIEKNNGIIKNNNENNFYNNNLLCHTKNINYYKRILSGKLSIRNIRKNKDKLDDNNEITPKSKNIFEKDNILLNIKPNNLNTSISKNTERFSSYKRNKIKINLSNSVNSKDFKKKNLEIHLKNNQNINIIKKFGCSSNKNECIILTNAIEKFNTKRSKKKLSEDKVRVSTVANENEKIFNSKNSCLNQNYLIFKKILKYPENQFNEEEKDTHNDIHIQESIVYNAQKETQIFNINHTINKIKKLKRIYENEINNATGNEKKNKEYFSTNNSNGNFQINNKKPKNKTQNEISQNNFINKKSSNNNNYYLDVSPIRKIDGGSSKEKFHLNKKLLNYDINNNQNKKINKNKYLLNENNKENSVNKKKSKNNYNTNHSINNLDINTNEFFLRNSNHKNFNVQSPKRLSKNNSNNYHYKSNKFIESERNSTKIPYILTTFNINNRSPLSSKKSINYSSCKNYSESIKVNKKLNNIRKNNQDKNKDNQKKSSLTNKLNSIKKNFNIDNKDIFILDNKKEDIINYINEHNLKMSTTHSQKYISNRSTYNHHINVSGKKDSNKKKNYYINKDTNNFENSEINIGKIKANHSNKDLVKSDMKIKNSFVLFNKKFNFSKKNKNTYYNDENENYNSKQQSKNKRLFGLDKNSKCCFEYSLSKDYSNLETHKNYVTDRKNNNKLKKKYNRSSSATKGIL